MLEEKVLNVVSAYVPQVESEERDKDVFWREMDKVL